MINPNGYFISSTTLPPTNSYPVMMMAVQNPFYATQAAGTSLISNVRPSQSAQPMVVMTPQIQPTPDQYYFQQSASEQQLNLMQQYQQQPFYQNLYAQLMQNQQYQQEQLQQQQQYHYQYAMQSALNAGIPIVQDRSSTGMPFNQMQFPVFMHDAASSLNTQQDQHVKQQEMQQPPINHFHFSTIDQNALINGQNYLNNKVSAKKDLSPQRNILTQMDSLLNSKKRTSVTSTVSTASSDSSNRKYSFLQIHEQTVACEAQNQENKEFQDENQKKVLSSFEPNIQTILSQMYEEYTKNQADMLAQTRRGSNTSIQENPISCGDNALEDLFNKNIYLKWAVHTNRASSFAKECSLSLISTNQKYCNLFKLKKRITKQLGNQKQLNHNNSSIRCSHSAFLNQQNLPISKQIYIPVFNQNQLESHPSEHAAAQDQKAGNDNKQEIIQKLEYSKVQQTDACHSQSSLKNMQPYFDQDSFDENIVKCAVNHPSSISDQNNQGQVTSDLKVNDESLVMTNPEFQKQVAINSNGKANIEMKTVCTCKKEQTEQVKEDKYISNNSEQDCKILLQSTLITIKSENIETKSENIIDFQQMDMENNVCQIEKEEMYCNNCGGCDSRKIHNSDIKEEKTEQKDMLNQGKKATNSKFHNMNKLFMYKLLSSFYLDNLEKLGVPFYMREIMKKLISQVKLSSKQQNQYQTKQKTDFFSHDHYNLLFLTLNNQTIQYILQNQNSRILHLFCFNFDLNTVKLPLESSSNPPHILEKIEFLNIVKKYACEIVLQSDLCDEKEDMSIDHSSPSSSSIAFTKQIYTKRALSGIKILNQGIIVKRF